MINQERHRWVELLRDTAMWLHNCAAIQPPQKAQLFDIIYSVFPLHCHQGIVEQYSGYKVGDIERNLMPQIV